MAKEYLPLRLAEQMKYHWDEQNGEVKNPGIQAFVNSLMGRHDNGENQPGPVTHEIPVASEDGKENKLNLDDFLSWVIGSTFCKKAYDGKYSDINTAVLKIARMRENKGISYKTSRRDFRNSMAFATVFQCWEKYKRAYRFDSDFVEELMQTNTVEIPTDILKRLPFRCFYLDLEEIPRFDPFKGIFAYIGFDERNGLPNLGIFRITEAGESGEIPILPCYTFGPDMQKHGMLFVNDKGESCLRFTNNHQLLGKLVDYEDKDIFDVVLFTLQAMLYLASNKPDIMESPKTRYINARKGTPNNRTADLDLTDVGVRYGTAIRKVKKAAAKGKNEEMEIVHVDSPKPRKPMVSHVRSAHWHHYWVGKGRTEQIVKWIPPTFIFGVGKEMPVTIQNVEK